MVAGELTIKYCPTELMLVVFYTKPLQEKLFRVFCNRILILEEDLCVPAASERLLECQETPLLNQNGIQVHRIVLDKVGIKK
eukprot:366402-Ditylum_brightwellii.AAC.1